MVADSGKKNLDFFFFLWEESVSERLQMVPTKERKKKIVLPSEKKSDGMAPSSALHQSCAKTLETHFGLDVKSICVSSLHF